MSDTRPDLGDAATTVAGRVLNGWHPVMDTDLYESLDVPSWCPTRSTGLPETDHPSLHPVEITPDEIAVITRARDSAALYGPGWLSRG